jgi:hypothetical protein
MFMYVQYIYPSKDGGTNRLFRKEADDSQPERSPDMYV